MKRTWGVLSFLCITAAPALADTYARSPYYDFFLADAIVIGAVNGVRLVPADEVLWCSGVLCVLEPLWGPLAQGARVSVAWTSRKGEYPGWFRYYGDPEEAAIWLLTKARGAQADCMAINRYGLASLDHVREQHSTTTLCVQGPYGCLKGAHDVTATVVFRNLWDVPRRFPGLVADATRVTTDTSIRLLLGGADTDCMPRLFWAKPRDYIRCFRRDFPFEGHLVRSQTIPSFRLLPGEERKVTLDLKQLFPIKRGATYAFQVRIIGYGESNDTWFVVPN